MAIRIDLHHQDDKELFRIRRELIGWRGIIGATRKEIAEASGHTEKWLAELERGVAHPKLSSLQDWCKMFGLRPEPKVMGLRRWERDEIPQAHYLSWNLAYGLSRPFEGGQWARAYIVADLIAYRMASGISATQHGRNMGLSISAVSAWERSGDDPLVSKLFSYVRALGGRLTIELIERIDWPHHQDK